MKMRSHAPRLSWLNGRCCAFLFLVFWVGHEGRAQAPAATPTGGGTAAQGAPTTPFRYGRIQAHPRATYSYGYSEGILILPGQPENTEQYSFSPGILVNLGDRWTVDYTATYNRNSNSAFRDAWGHDLQFSGAVQGREWALQSALSYASTVSTLVETGRETAQESVSSTLGLMRPISSKVSFQSSLETGFRFVETLPDTYQLSTTQALSYLISPRVNAGFAIRTGYAVAYKAPDAVSVSPLLQWGWKPGDKLAVSFSGGYERRILVSEKGGEADSPVFSASLSYKPFEFTTLAIAGTRSMSTSLFADQVSKSRGWTASLEQRVLKHFTVAASGALNTGDFVTVTPDNETINRHDSLNSFDVRVSTTFLRRGSLSFNYGEVRNTSSESGFTTSSRRIGVQAGFSY